ncbi:hypothetical protein [Bernardetia sp.]|uniref:hypothetical protein n=1 Tax=Bernardetia sp. TaxID=1937974 RepID=UPI0025BBF02C|nr:hypothetical protein [Bernardetia sp.]
MKRILISLSDSEKEQKEEKLLQWLKEENIRTEALDNYVQTEVNEQLRKKEQESKEDLREEVKSEIREEVEENLRFEMSSQTEEKIKKTSKKMRLVAVVSLGVILILGGIAFLQMLETDKQKELLKESQKEAKLHRQVVQQLQDSIIAREMRHKAVISKQLPVTSDTTNSK